jgi:hypothetical protein
MSLAVNAMGVKVGNSLRKLVLIKLADNANMTKANAGLLSTHRRSMRMQQNGCS